MGYRRGTACVWRCSNVAPILAAKSSTLLRFIGTRMRWLMCRCLKPIQAFHSLLTQSEKPDVAYNIQEIREPVELPHTQDELYEQIGVDPPRGVLLYGPPMLAKAVTDTHHSTAAFIRGVGSEFVLKYLGEGP